MYGVCVEVQAVEHPGHHGSRRCMFIRLFHMFAYRVAIKNSWICTHSHIVPIRYGETGAAVLYHDARQDRETYSTQRQYPPAHPGETRIHTPLSLSLLFFLML